MRWDLQINNCCPQYGHFFKLRQTQIIEKPCCIKKLKTEIALQAKQKANQYVAPVSPHSQPGWPSISQTPPPYTQYASTSASSDSSCILVVMNNSFSLMKAPLVLLYILRIHRHQTKRKYTNSSLDSWRCFCQNFVIGVGCFACWTCTRKLVRCAPKVWRSDENKWKMHDSVIRNLIENQN